MIIQMKFFRIPSILLVLLLINLRASILGHSHEVNSRIRCLESERQGLLRIKQGFIDTHGRLSSWGNERNKRDCCKWKGVKCHNRTNHVIRLDLHNKFDFSTPPLEGTIITSLLELHHLEYLDLSFNFFGHTSIPEFFGSLSELRYLKLANANFGGPIPHHLGNLSKLLYLDLSGNDCSSESLDWISHIHSLEFLDLTATDLSKATNWLQAINKLTSIKELHLGFCELPDTDPFSLHLINASAPLSILDLTFNRLNSLALCHWFSNFSSSALTSIDLYFNTMSGTIPNIFQNMISLAHLDLSANDFHGGIPNFFGNMSNLVYLDLSGNNLTGEFLELMMNFSGPTEEKLEYLDLSFIGITGLFSNMSMFSSLRHLKLGGNQLSGTIQEGYLKLPYLRELDLSANQLIGPLPHDISLSSSLKILNMKGNKFNGTLSESIGRLSKLKVLQLASNHLEGRITEAHMFNLSQLRELDLSLNSHLIVKCKPYWFPPFQLRLLRLHNCILGPHFPLWLRTQKKLREIDISSAGISDNIPSWFGGVAPKLLYLNASNNQMYGLFPNFSFLTITRSFSAYMIPIRKVLDLSSNKISGSINFLCQTREWVMLDLSSNMFSGQIPDCFAHFKWLEYLNLSNNNFSGKIPHTSGSWKALYRLYLHNNSFSGELPNSLANCTNLMVIDFGENRLTGKIPAWIGGFSQLRVLIFRFNAFIGSIPSNFCDLANIHVLDLSSNKISGSIPDCVDKYTAMARVGNENMPFFNTVSWFLLFKSDLYNPESAYFMWKGIEVKYINNLDLVRLIDLSNNNLVGQIPPQITKLVTLVGLNLSINNLTGCIPQKIGQMNLDFLDISRNQLSGSIPTSLGELSFLGVLNMSYNNLSGRIPQSTKLLTFNESTYMGNSGLCGLPLNKSCPGDVSHQDPNLENNPIGKEEFEDNDFISGEFYIALGIGFIVGFWGIFGMILFNKAMRYTFLRVLNTIEDFVYVRLEITKARLLRHL